MMEMGTEKKEEYVKRLSAAVCTCGSMEYQYLNLPKDHGVYYQDTDHPLMNANDHHGKKHVMHFGRCSSDSNPKNVMSDLLSKTVPVLGLLNMAKEAMGCSGCKCAPRTLRSWEVENIDNRLDGAPGISNTSELTCMYGGVITITEIPADDSQKAENEENKEEAEEEKDILDTLPAGMADKIRQMNGAEAMAADTQDWYGDNGEFFAQDYACTPQMSAQNYANNSTQMISADCMNGAGFITNTEGLANFNVAGTNAAAIGGGCAAAYNVLQALGSPVGLAEVIRGMERKQTVAGFIDQGPVAVSMCAMADFLSGMGFSTGLSFPAKLTANAMQLQKGQVAVLGTSKKKPKKKDKLAKGTMLGEASMKQNRRIHSAAKEMEIFREESFCTITRGEKGLVCAEKPHLPIEAVFQEKSEGTMMLMTVDAKNKIG